MNPLQSPEGFFYQDRDALTKYSATLVLKYLFQIFDTQKSIVDVGCGVGTWLAVAEHLGANQILGLEAPWIQNVSDMTIDKTKVMIVDLEEHWTLPGDYDLGICLEVAEHLNESSGTQLVRELTNKCNIVLFSAAVPGQGGHGHINEQWPLYWQKKFQDAQFEAIDCIRPLLWNQSNVPWWYRQNIILYARKHFADQYYEKISRSNHLRSTELPNLLAEKQAASNKSVSKLKSVIRILKTFLRI
jgi:SAM-dependent methyltransferase